MNLNEFPSSPSEGDTYLIGNVTYKYTQGVWAVVSQVKTNFRAIIERLCKESGLNMVRGSFDEGATVTNPTDVIWDEFSGKYYSWAGTFPKVVAAGATPATSGGIGAGAWVDRTDVTLRSEIINRFTTVNLSSFSQADPSGLTSSDNAMDAAISTGASVVLDGEDSTYLFTKPFYLKSGQYIIQQCKSVNVSFANAVGGRNIGLFNHVGTLGSTVATITANISEFATSIQVDDASDFSDGDWVYLNVDSGVQYPYNADNLTPYANYLVQIGHIDGNTIYLNYRFGYNIAALTGINKSITKANPVFNGGVVGLKIKDISTSTDPAFHPSAYVRKFAVNCEAKYILAIDLWWCVCLNWYATDCDTFNPVMINGNQTFTEGGNAYAYAAVGCVRNDCYKPQSSGARHTADLSHTAYCHVIGGTGNDTGQTISMHGQYDHDCSIENFNGGVISTATAPGYGNTCTRINIINCNGRYLHIAGGGEYNIINSRFREEPLLLKAGQINFIDTRMPVAFGADGICVPDTRFGATKLDFTRGRLYLTTSGDNKIANWDKVSIDGARIVNQLPNYALILFIDVDRVIIKNQKEIFNVSFRVTGDTTFVDISDNADIKKTLTGSVSELEQFAIRDTTAGNFIQVKVTGNEITGNNSSSKWLAITNFSNAGGTTVTYQLLEGNNIVTNSSGINIPSDSRVTALITKLKDSYYNVTADVCYDSTSYSIASASTVTLPDNGDYFEVTGSTAITTLTASRRGRIVSLKSNSGTWSLPDSPPFYLSSAFTATSNDIITLLCDGTYWHEISRSVN